MKVSIIIPVYNVEEYIADCLNSVINQTYKGDLECILVDDCTPDNSCTIIEKIIGEYNGKIQFKLIHHTQNKGLSGARNTGIDNASGDYLYFLDSDDELTQDCIDTLCEPLSEFQYDVILGNYSVIPGKTNFKSLLKLQTCHFNSNDEILKVYTSRLIYVMAWNKLCKATFLKDNNLYFEEGLIHEDDLWSFMLFSQAESVLVNSKITYFYRLRNNSIMVDFHTMKHWIAYTHVTQNMLQSLKTLSVHKRSILLPFIYHYQRSILNDVYNRGQHDEFMVIYKELKRQFGGNFYILRCSLKSFVASLHFYYPLKLGTFIFKIQTKIRNLFL